MTIRRTIQLATIAIAAIAIAGCTDDKPVPMELTDRGIVRDTSREPFEPMWSHPNPLAYTPSPGVSQTGSEIVKHDPLLSDAPKPFDIAGPVPDDNTADNPPVDLADPLVNPSRPKNWYWLKGNIRGGEVQVTVNGRYLGKFSVHMDKEITDYLRPGYNKIEFTPAPYLQTSTINAKLNVVYSQQDPGEPPVLVYDSTRLDSMRADHLPSHAPKIGGPSFDANPNETSALNQVPDLGPRTTTMNLMAR